MALDKLLETLSERTKNADITLGPLGTCRLLVDGKIGLTIEKTQTGDGAILYCVVANVPEVGREQFYLRLLRAQLFYAEIGEGCAFGVDPATNEVLLNRRVAFEGMTGDRFYAVVNEFVNWAEHWQNQLSGDQMPEPIDSGSLESMHQFL